MRIRSWRNNERRARLLMRTAREIKNYVVQKKILTSLLAMLLVMTGTLFTVSALYKETGSFTVGINKYDMTKYGLTLSETRDMMYNTSNLNADIAEEITNIAEEQLPDNLDEIDGEHNGQNHIAYTFYLQNAGEVELSYQYSLNISGITNGLDEAVRIRLYVDGVPTTYAKTSSSGSGPEPNTTAFYNSVSAVNARVENFEPGEQTKFTIVIWIEGTDPDCIDWLIGGQLKVDMEISVVH